MRTRVVLMLVVLWIYISHDEITACPNSFTKHDYYFNKCYHLSTTKIKGDEYETYCSSKGGQRASIHNKAMQDFVSALATEDYTIGALWTNNPLVFYWADGQIFDHWDNFVSGVSPSNNDDNVYVKYSTGKWNFDMGSHQHVAACDYTVGEQTDRHYALVDGDSMCGRLEVFHDGFWGTIYDSNPDIKLGYFLCNHLGYEFDSYDSSCVSNVGTGIIWSNDFVCVSNATTIDDCFPGQTTWDTSVTDHTYDVYVRCKEKSTSATEKQTSTVLTTTEETTSGSTTEETSGSTTEETTSGSMTEETKSGSTTEETTSGSKTEESKTSTEAILYPSTTEYCLTNCNVIHNITETVIMTQNITVTETVTVITTITTSGTIIHTISSYNSTPLESIKYNKRTSAMYSTTTVYDMRPSAVVIGTAGVFILCAILGFVIGTDCIHLVKFLMNIRFNMTHLLRRKNSKFNAMRKKETAEMSVYTVYAEDLVKSNNTTITSILQSEDSTADLLSVSD
ncbi:unnamed protein product [Mytilus coruscus]|uniref:C-type lectin domain-containing protein n=1 Tax=Mytilus coruscus TaxID=42192 RepID=A0A6J8EWM2_MYTCO|nr:unnamed protein product [Mytilus coruscus]